MFRFLHSADWQLGARFSQFGAQGARLREARLETLQRALALARQHTVDAFLIAGDLFEDNQVSDALVAETVDAFRRYPDVQVYILPGNHDPFTGPDCVWQRKAFLPPNIPNNIHILRDASVHALDGDKLSNPSNNNNTHDHADAATFLITSPLHQKRSTIDPSLKLAELAATLPPNAIKIGVTHGALAIESKHQPNDFPIALNAATRAGLDYLAIGHWHNWLADTDSGRIVMPGTPEPDRFANDDSGHIALVEIAAPGQQPTVQSLHVATLTWRSLDFDFASLEASRATLSTTLKELTPNATHTVLRITLTGTASTSAIAEIHAWLEPLLAPFLVGQLIDNTRVALTPAEFTDLQTRHPILAQVLADIDRLETFATGNTAITNTTSAVPTAPVANSPITPTPFTTTQPPHTPTTLATPTSPPLAPLTLAEAQALLAPAKIELASLTPEHFAQLRQTIFQTLKEVES